jgi:hypothetical protein
VGTAPSAYADDDERKGMMTSSSLVIARVSGRSSKHPHRGWVLDHPLTRMMTKGKG